jgi:hypothetical protein
MLTGRPDGLVDDHRALLRFEGRGVRATGRVIAAWPSFGLIGSYELPMRRVHLVLATPLRRVSVLRILSHWVWDLA